MKIPPFDISLTICTGRYITVTITYIYIQEPSWNRDDPQDDYRGYTDIEYTHGQDLTMIEQLDLKKRVYRYINKLYASQEALYDDFYV